jgi:multiple sugar transport system permease protein
MLVWKGDELIVTSPLSKDPTTAQRRLLNQKSIWGLIFVIPVILYLVIFSLGPILFSFWVSLNDWNLIAPLSEMKFRGFANYAYIFQQDDTFRQALFNTIKFTVLGVTANTILGLAGALLLNSRLKYRALWRTIFFLPMVTAPLALGMMWGTLLNKNFGLINRILLALGLPAQPFLSSPDQALYYIILIAVYQYVGYYIVVFTAGLQGIPQEYFDAAAVDGANSWETFWHITLPLLRPVLLFLVVTNTIGALQVFDIVFATTTGGAETSGGGPAGSTMVVVLHMYNNAFKFFRMGRASAMAIILFAVIFLVTLLQLRLARERG